MRFSVGGSSLCSLALPRILCWLLIGASYDRVCPLGRNDKCHHQVELQCEEYHMLAWLLEIYTAHGFCSEMFKMLAWIVINYRAHSLSYSPGSLIILSSVHTQGQNTNVPISLSKPK